MPNVPERNLTQQYISQSFQYLLQISESVVYDGIGNTVDILDVSASYATSASYAVVSNTLNGFNQNDYVLNSSTSSFVLNSQTSSMTVLSSSYAISSSKLIGFEQSDYVQNSATSSFVLNSQTSSMTVLSSSYAITASYVDNTFIATTETVSTVVTSSTLTVNDYTVLCNCSASSITLTIPALHNKKYSIKKIDNSINRVILTGSLFDNNASFIITSQWESYTIHYSGSGYYVI